MSYTVINYKEVITDVLNAKSWYKKQQKGLEKRFANEVKTTISYIIKNPLLFQVKYKTITVLGVFHTSIAPSK